MSRSKRSLEGELFMDHRFTPGLPNEIIRNQGLPAGAGQGLYECPSFTCNHCCRVVFINRLRNRPQHYCKGCDHYICGNCSAILAVTKECKTFEQIIEETQELAVKQELALKREGKNNGQTIYHGK